MRDLGVIIWPRQSDSRYGHVSDREGQVVFNRSVMFAAVMAMIFRSATIDTTTTGSVGVWLVLIGSFVLSVAWGRYHYQHTGSKLPARVLIVEDEASSRELLARTIRTRGWDVDTAGDLATGVMLLARNPSVVIADIGLPDGSGLDLFAHVRRGRSAPRTVILTGQSDPEVLARIKRVGTDVVVYKPIASVDGLLDSLGDPFDPDRTGQRA